MPYVDILNNRGFGVFFGLLGYQLPKTKIAKNSLPGKVVKSKMAAVIQKNGVHTEFGQ